MMGINNEDFGLQYDLSYSTDDIQSKKNNKSFQCYTYPLTYIRNSNTRYKGDYNENIYMEKSINYDDSNSALKMYTNTDGKIDGKIVDDTGTTYQYNTLNYTKEEIEKNKNDNKKLAWNFINQISIKNSSIVKDIINILSNIQNLQTDKNNYKYDNLLWKFKIDSKIIPYNIIIKQLQLYMIIYFGDNLSEDMKIFRNSQIFELEKTVEKTHFKVVTKNIFKTWYDGNNPFLYYNNKHINNNFCKHTLLNSSIDKNAVNDFKYMYKKFITESDGISKFYDFDFRIEMKIFKGLGFDFHISKNWPNDPIRDLHADQHENKMHDGIRADAGAGMVKMHKLYAANVHPGFENDIRTSSGMTIEDNPNIPYRLGRVIVPYDLQVSNTSSDGYYFNGCHFLDNIYTIAYPDRNNIGDLGNMSEYYEILGDTKNMIITNNIDYIHENKNIQMYKPNLYMNSNDNKIDNMICFSEIYDNRYKPYNYSSINTYNKGILILNFDLDTFIIGSEFIKVKINNKNLLNTNEVNSSNIDTELQNIKYAKLIDNREEKQFIIEYDYINNIEKATTDSYISISNIEKNSIVKYGEEARRDFVGFWTAIASGSIGGIATGYGIWRLRNSTTQALGKSANKYKVRTGRASITTVGTQTTNTIPPKANANAKIIFARTPSKMGLRRTISINTSNTLYNRLKVISMQNRSTLGPTDPIQKANIDSQVTSAINNNDAQVKNASFLLSFLFFSISSLV